MSMRKQLLHLLASMGYTIDGFKACARDETAFRQELVVGVVHLVLIALLGFPLVSKVFLTVLYGLLLAVELLNTAIEATVDCAVVGKHPLAKKAKDCASAAVFCIIVLYVIGWVVVLADYLGLLQLVK